MIACHEAEALIARRIDGEETRDDARALDAHLAGCPACTRRFEAERAVDAALAARLSGLEAPPAFAARVRQRVEAEGSVPARAGWIPDVLNGAGVLVSLLVAAPLAGAAGGGVTGTMVGLAAVLVGIYPLLLASWSDAGPDAERLL